MIFTEWNWDDYWEVKREEFREEFLEEGIEKGYKKAKAEFGKQIRQLEGKIRRLEEQNAPSPERMRR